MKITRIKLAGFKSFVDPTILKLPGDLTCIVGPNGCGKSNIIDAINWVMGESSAKHLRGDSMADVIFNGSNSRKPVGQASVEIVLDNADGTIGGQYAGFNEIAIKRQVNRDGTSSYFLNSARCRRKDITSVFLGTGLGSRGYSVIEQGMISRVIEAKPEELRGFLEEAAGISKYKERRRETENRIRHTVENLDRVNDIRNELEKQLGHLKRQAEAAEKYNALKQEERQIEAELLALNGRALAAELATLESRVGDRRNAVESLTSELRSVEARETGLAETRSEAAERVSETQRRFYETSAEIDRSEQGLKYRRDRLAALEGDLERIGEEETEIEALRRRDEDALAAVTAELAEREPALEEARARRDATTLAVQECDAALRRWQEQWDALRQERSDILKSRELAAARAEHLEHSLAALRTRLDEVTAAHDRIDTTALKLEAVGKGQIVEGLSESLTALRQRLGALNGELTSARETSRVLAEDLEDKRRASHDRKVRLASLQALQEAALGTDSEAWVEWLAEHGLQGAPRLFQDMRIEAGWERAVERVSRVRVDAFMVARDDVARLTALAPEHVLALVYPGAAPVQRENTALTAAGLRPLAHYVSGSDYSAMLLGGVYAADSREDAEANIEQLESGEVIATRDGLLFGPGWIEVAGRQTDVEQSVLSRAAEIDELTAYLASLEEQVSALHAALDEAHAREHLLAERLANGNAERDDLGERLAQAQTRASQVSAARDQADQERERLVREQRSIAAQIAALEQELAQAADRCAAGDGEAAEVESRLEGLKVEQTDLADRAEAARAELAATQQAFHALEIELERLRVRKDNLAAAIEGYRERFESLEQRRTRLTDERTETAAPVGGLEETLQRAVAARQTMEQDLNLARARLAEVDTDVKEAERERHALEQRIGSAREELQAIQLESRTLEVRGNDVRERLAQMDVDYDAIVAALDEAADAEAWNERLAAIQRKIGRLGAINMAAIEEYTQLEERKSYLDSQHADLTSALDTLRDAIRTIDKETRTRFRETYEKVNAGLKAMFPRLFGGGHAYLEMTSDDLLETGITVMARPPGKRNSTIHLLSGGEKALTAIAFIFSIFELAPAPFCLLDEVDAPLDDNNVVRLTEMLKEMSGGIQFAIVTHNKITMEIAEQLIGVTMNEPGVSRLVSVSMDEAIEMAQSA